MKVRCLANNVRELDAPIIDKMYNVDVLEELCVGECYDVVAMEDRPDGVIIYIHSSDDLYYPIPYPDILFEYVDREFPPDWISKKHKNLSEEYVVWAAKIWASDRDFYEKLLNEDEGYQELYNSMR